MPPWIETRLIHDDDVDRRLAEIGLTRSGLLRVVAVANTERKNATDLYPLNAPGTFAYHHGVAELRRQFLGSGWKIDRSGGIETIQNDTLNMRVAFCNVEEACGSLHPKPRTEKGPGAERACSPMLFDDLPAFVAPPREEILLYYVMIDSKGAAELTRPVIEGGTFTGAVERIFLSKGGEDEAAVLPLDTDISTVSFDPMVVRK